MSFNDGDTVFIRSLQKKGVIDGVLKPGYYRVTIGNLSMNCKEAELTAVREIAGTSDARRSTHLNVTSPAVIKSLERLDLHGLRVHEALQRVEERLDKAILADLDRLEIVHGVGSGKIMEALHKLLTVTKAVKHFKMDQNNPGVTWVYF